MKNDIAQQEIDRELNIGAAGGVLLMVVVAVGFYFFGSGERLPPHKLEGFKPVGKNYSFLASLEVINFTGSAPTMHLTGEVNGDTSFDERIAVIEDCNFFIDNFVIEMVFYPDSGLFFDVPDYVKANVPLSQVKNCVEKMSADIDARAFQVATNLESYK